METEIRYNRFKDAEWFGENKEIIIGGVGGTGSNLAILLSRTGEHTLHIYDADTFEEHNKSGQWVLENQVDVSKVEATKQNILNFSGKGVKVETYKELYTEDSPSNEIVFACFDNMLARKVMYEKWKEYCLESDNKEEFLFVDLRLLAESLTIFFVQGHKDQFEKYESNLFDDSEVPDVECTLKQTSHAASLIASLTVGFFTNWCANRKINVDYRQVPFRTDYLIGANLFEYDN